MAQLTQKERMMLFAAKAGYASQNAVEKQLGMSAGSIAHYKDKVPNSTLIRFKAVFPQVNIEWLRTGEGDCYEEEQPKAQELSAKSPADEMLAFKEELITQLKETIDAKDALIQSLREQIAILKSTH